MNLRIINDRVFINGKQVNGEKSKPSKSSKSISDMGWFEAIAVCLLVVVAVLFMLACSVGCMALTGFLVLKCFEIIGYGLVAQIGWLNSIAVGFLIAVATRIFGGRRSE